ncbi:MAG: hypothetical protein HFE46_08020 [Clostridia bacterium]|nr:hypothetical protein [Clostridia bacterium]
MFEKIADIIGKLNTVVWLAIAAGIVVAVFVVLLALSMGGDLGKFKKIAKQVIKKPDLQTCNATAKQLPTRVRKQYKTVKQTGAKPDDVITPDACVYAPFKESVASSFPNAVMSAGILCILLSFFVGFYVKDAAETFLYILTVPAIVTVLVMILRLAAGLISSAILKSGVKAYNGYVSALASVLHGGHAAAEQAPVMQDEPISNEPPVYAQAQAAYGNTFDEPTHITVELEDEPVAVTAEPEPIAAEPEPVRVEPEPIVMQEPQESEEELRARARAEAMAAARAEQAAAQAAAAQAQAQAAAQAQAQAAAQAAAQARAAQQAQAAQAAQTAQAAAPSGASSADEVIARIEKIKQEGASLAQMKEVALQLQKERAKPENKTPEQQRRLNEALAALLKAMSSATKR